MWAPIEAQKAFTSTVRTAGWLITPVGMSKPCNFASRIAGVTAIARLIDVIQQSRRAVQRT